jgi:predicted permease
VDDGDLSFPDYEDVRERSRSFEGLTATRGLMASFVRRRDEPAQSRFGLAVSASFFDVLRVRPALGRAFLADEDRAAGRDAVVVLSHDTWSEAFAADPGIIGRDVHLAGRPFTVVGVAPEGFTGVEIYLRPAFYVPMAMLPALDPSASPDTLDRRDARSLRVMGRLQSGVSLSQASQDVERIARALQQEYPATNAGQSLTVRTEMEARLAEYAPLAALSAILIGLALAVLLVACANVAGLLTSRAPLRAREIAVRTAVGGGRVRLVRQLITESTLIALAGGVAGIAIGFAGIRSFQQFQIATDAGVRLSYELDRRALVVGLIVAALSALLSSAIPAWRSTRLHDLSSTLRNTTSPGSRTARLWGRHGLVASQIALTLVLLTVALAFYRAFEAEYGPGPGFRTDRILLTNLDPTLAKYELDRIDAFYRQLKERVTAIPGVRSVALTTFIPLNQDFQDRMTIVPEGFELPAGTTEITVAGAGVDEDYFATLGIPIVRGRGFEAGDTREAPRVAVISRGMGAQYWPGEDPLGKRIRVTGADAGWVQIVGVAEDVKFRLFTPASTPFLYLPRLQRRVTRSTLVASTDGASADVAAQVRAAIAETSRDVPILSMRTIESFYSSNVKNLNRVVVRTVAGMGVMGLALALIGLYGLTAYAVSRRTREIGIRMAMGARPASMLRMVLRQGALPSVAGVAAGVIASIGVGGLIQSLLPGTAADGVTYLLIVPAVAAVVTIAAYIPARSAARIDPLAALKQD